MPAIGHKKRALFSAPLKFAIKNPLTTVTEDA